MFRLCLASASLAALAACATAPEPSADAPEPPAATAAAPSTLDLAMETADSLVAAGNEQAAIDRLTQLIGNPDLTDADKASILYKRAKLRFGDGNNVYGAIEDLDEMLILAPGHSKAEEAMAMRDTARGEATSLNGMLEAGTLGRTDRFEALFRLGKHQEAIDLMLETGLTPGNTYLVDLYQMGYLCEDPELTGPAYEAVEPDGTVRNLQFCDFGK